MLFESLDKIKRNAIISSILLVAIGAIILICPVDYIPTMILGCGYSLVIVAIVMVFDFLSSKKSLMDYIKFVSALLLGFAGISTLIFRDNIMLVLAWLFGFLMILDGLRTFIHSLTFARRSERKGWWVLSILSALMMVAGIMLFVNPWFKTTESLMKVIGGTVMFSAIMSGLRLIWTWPVRKEKEIEGGKNDV